jgi:hypothetical protein
MAFGIAWTPNVTRITLNAYGKVETLRGRFGTKDNIITNIIELNN